MKLGRTFSRRELLESAAKLGAFGVGTAALGPLTDAGRLGRMLGQERENPTLRPPGAALPSRQLILATLYGGNDGLNTVVPYAESAYVSQRSAMRIMPNQVLPLVPGLGLHPSMIGIHELWKAGHVAIVQGVGYPDPNLSHFASMAIWMAGSTDGDVSTGWLGRWLDATGSDPFRALSIGATIPQALCGENQQASALQDSTEPQSQLAAGSSGFQQIYKMVQQVTRQDGAIENLVAESGTNLIDVGNTAAKALTKEQPLTVAGRDAGDIGTQLSVAGELILAGLPTKAYQVSMGGFDTHSDELGTQAELFSQLDAGVTALFNGLGRSERGVGTVLVLYTEFGRRVLANASGGTDHGSANVVFVIGREVRGGLYGEYPSLTRLDPNGNLVHTVDYRSVYATLIEHVLEIESKPFLGQSWPLLKFI